ncbi:hypothetical protein E2C01_097821 [Portunus trituberculatus]|uniref:Uncharacterized protein n=1 Tax=Portunus trituberculatus TaxID=210409 RepID=A0A5B7K5D4_PORTR|nr:hypothetical protein [Portunus trituberculatus]
MRNTRRVLCCCCVAVNAEPRAGREGGGLHGTVSCLPHTWQSCRHDVVAEVVSTIAGRRPSPPECSATA